MPNPARTLTFRGETKPISHWAKVMGVPVSTIKTRVDKFGWDVEKALTTPIKHIHGRRQSAQIRVPPVPRRHKSRNLAYVRVGGKAIYLGPWGSEKAANAYERFLARWRMQPQPRIDVKPGEPVTVLKLATLYIQWAQSEFVKFGRVTSEVSCRRIACRVLCSQFGRQYAEAFTPKMLEECQVQMIADGFTRSSINLHTWRIRDVWRWGTKEGLVSVTVWQALKSVRGVRVGKGAVESKRVAPVAAEVFTATVDKLKEPYRSIARLQRLLGCRPGEVCGMKVGDIDRRQSEWRYAVRPELNKQAAKQREQVYWLGPICQALLQPFIVGKADGEYLFQPVGANGRGPAKHITADLYREKIAAACKRAAVPHWHPHQLRHNKATEVRAEYGAEAALAVIGDSTDAMLQIYSERNEAVARKVARETS